MRVVLTGDRSEVGLVESVRAAVGDGAISLAGELSIGEASSPRRDRAAAPLQQHGACPPRCGRGDAVVLYALTNLQHTPWSVPSRVLSYDVPCRGCRKSVCPLVHNACLRMVTPDEVSSPRRTCRRDGRGRRKETTVGWWGWPRPVRRLAGHPRSPRNGFWTGSSWTSPQTTAGCRFWSDSPRGSWGNPFPDERLISRNSPRYRPLGTTSTRVPSACMAASTSVRSRSTKTTRFQRDGSSTKAADGTMIPSHSPRSRIPAAIALQTSRSKIHKERRPGHPQIRQSRLGRGGRSYAVRRFRGLFPFAPVPAQLSDRDPSHGG